MTDETRLHPPSKNTAGFRPWRTPVAAWAVLGGLFVAFQIWVYGRWIIDGGLGSLRSDGSQVPPATKTVVWVFQGLVVAIFVLIGIVLVRQCRRARAITFDAALFFGWLSANWSNAIANYFHTGLALNPYQLHVISWGPYLPGWHNPATTIESALATGMICMGVMILAPWTAKWMISVLARSLHPRAAVVVAIPFVTVFAVGTILVWTLIGMASFIGATDGPTLFGGHYYQVSLIDAAAVTCFAYIPQGAAMYFAERRRTEAAPLRGSDLLPPRVQPWARLLAGAGVVNLGYLAYVVVLSLSLTGTAPPDTPGYFFYGTP